MVEGNSACSLFQRTIESTVEMKLEQADTADAACIQEFPMLLDQEWLFLNRQLPLQGPQDTFEDQAVLFLGHIVTREVDINAPTGQLRIDLAEGSHFIGANQNMAHPSG